MNAALTFRNFGEPASVLQWESVPDPIPEPGQVVVRVAASPVNPADINFIQGQYGILPTLPAVPGIEGAGWVESSRHPAWQPGDPVLIAGPGCWAERLVRSGDDLIRVPEELPLSQAALARVNPPTAWWMMEHFVAPRPGDWLAQNAATSGVGRAVIQLARFCGWRTVNFLRGTDRIQELRDLGGDLVFEDTDEGHAAAAEALGDHRPRLALNAVGGESLLRLATLTSDGGTLVTYGAMGRQANKLPNKFLIFRGLHFTGFWLSRFEQNRPPQAGMALRRKLLDWMVAGALRLPVARQCPMPEGAAACEAKEPGKTLLVRGQT